MNLNEIVKKLKEVHITSDICILGWLSAITSEILKLSSFDIKSFISYLIHFCCFNFTQLISGPVFKEL